MIGRHYPKGLGQSPHWQSCISQSVALLLAAGLLAVISAAGASPASAQEVPATGESSGRDPAPNPNSLSAIDPASLTGFRDRPLFSPSRTRPPDPVSEPVPEATETVTEQPRAPVTLQLLGVIGTPDGIQALVRDESDDTRHLLKKGDVFHGWSVVSLDRGEMVLNRDGEAMRFPTFRPSNVEPSEDVPGSEAPGSEAPGREEPGSEEPGNGTEPMPDLEGSGMTP